MRRFYLLAAIASFASISGCYWDSELYDTFVADDGNVEHCPGMTSIRYYTDKQSDTNGNTQTSFIECRNSDDGIECTKDGIQFRHTSGSWQLVNPSSNTPSSDKPDDKQTELKNYLTGKHASMALSFKHDICPKNFFCKTEDKEAYCTNKEIIVQEVVCGEGTKKCGDACYDTKTDLNHCGECGNDCLKLDLSPNASTYKCESGKCVPVCNEGYHVKEDEENGKTCTEDDEFNCKGINCKENIPGWATGKCKGGECEIETCQENMYLSNNKCEVVSNANCGEVGKACKDNQKCIYQDNKYDCIDISCKEISPTLRDCGTKGCLPEATYACGTDCINCYDVQFEHASKRSCNDEGQCEFECDAGYHMNENKNACECNPGYHSNEDGTICIEDTADECGSERKKCTYQEICENGSCKHIPQCLETYDCDRDGKCETSLMDYGLESCEKCGSGYTQCGRTKTRGDIEIPLCLKLEGISETECTAICNYDDWKSNDNTNPCSVNKYICCKKNNNDKKRWHTQVVDCTKNENLCGNNASVIFTYLEKEALEKKLGQDDSIITPTQPSENRLYTYRVKSCSSKQTCKLDTNNHSVTTNDDGNRKTFFPLIVNCK